MHRGGAEASVQPTLVLLLLHLAGCIQARDNGPSLPDSPCHTQGDCVAIGWMEPLPECDNFTCTCPSGTCPIYTTSSGTFDYQYFCGPCGMLGSNCNNNTDCVVDWHCKKNFCECDQGSAYQGVWRKTLRKLLCHSSSESEDEISRVVASNPQSNDKTAAFTIANTDFMATDEDPELTWAIERSLRYNEPGASTWSSTTSSFPPPDPRFVRSHPASQPGPSGWRQSPEETRPQRRTSRSSLSSTLSSRHRHSTGTVSSYSSSFPSASLRNAYPSLTSSSRPSSLALSDQVSLPTLESLRMECDVDDFQSTRV